MYTRSFENELYHYGVKGMKWGIRKREDTPSGPRTAWGRRRQTTNQHNAAIKKRYQDARSAVESGKLSKKSTEYKQARNARIKNLAGRAAIASVAGKSAQGRYYQYREKGETKAKAVLKTVGHNAVSSAAVRAAAVAGTAVLGLTAAGLSSDYVAHNPNTAVAQAIKKAFYR